MGRLGPADDQGSRRRRSADCVLRGVVRPRPAGKVPVFLDLAGAGQTGSAWAAGFAGRAGVIALSRPWSNPSASGGVFCI